MALQLARALSLTAAVALLGAVVTLASSPIRQLTGTSASNLRPAWSPDGRRIAFQGSAGRVYHAFVMNADGTQIRELTDGDFDDRHPAWSPDGRYVAVDSGDMLRREIWVIDVGSRARRRLTDLGAVASFPSWSPDGKRLSFYLYRNGVVDLWAVSPDGTGPLQLTVNLASERANNCTFTCHAATWSPDSSRIALQDADQSRVLVMPAQGGTPEAISPEDEHSHFPLFLADGRIAYVTEHIAQVNSFTDVWVSDPSGGQRTRLIGGVQAQGPFELSADGRELLFASPQSGAFQIYAVTLDDAGKAALARLPDSLATAPAAAASRTPERAPFAIGLPTDPLPYALALGGLALFAIGVELIARGRGRSRTSR